MNLNTGAPSIHEIWRGLSRDANVGGLDTRGPRSALLHLDGAVAGLLNDQMRDERGYARALRYLLDAARRSGITLDMILAEAGERR